MLCWAGDGDGSRDFLTTVGVFFAPSDGGSTYAFAATDLGRRQTLLVDLEVRRAHARRVDPAVELTQRRELLEEMPPFIGGGSMIRKVTKGGTTYAAPPAQVLLTYLPDVWGRSDSTTVTVK